MNNQKTSFARNPLSKNIRLYYLIASIYSLGVYLANSTVIFFLMTAKGLSISDIALLQSGYETVVLLVSFIGGNIADLLGRKKALLIGLPISTFSFPILAFGSNMLHFLVSQVSLGISFGFIANSLTPFVVDSLLQTNRPKKDVTRTLSNGITLMQLMSTIAGVSAGFIGATYGLSYPILIGPIIVMLSIIPVVVSVEPYHSSMSKASMLNLLKGSAGYIYKEKNALKLTIVAFFDNFSLMIVSLMWVPILKEQGLNVQIIGLYYSLISITVALAAFTAGKLSKRFSEKKLIISTFPPAMVFLVLVALGTNISWLLMMLLLWQACQGLRMPTTISWFNLEIPMQTRASISALRTITMRTGGIAATTALALISSLLEPQRLLLLAIIGHVISLTLYLSTSPSRSTELPATSSPDATGEILKKQ